MTRTETLPDTQSSVSAGDAARSHGLIVAKWSLHGDRIDCLYYSDAQSESGDNCPRSLTLVRQPAGEGFAGEYRLTASDGGEKSWRVEVIPVGEQGYRLTAFRDGEEVARGLGLVDPFDDQSLMISWWTGDILPYGIVKYSIHDDHSLRAWYISEMSPTTPGSGTAVGDTTNGFPGVYTLTYEEQNGNTWGPYEWTLSARGEVIDIRWKQDGVLLCSGFGIVDPHGPPAIIVNYCAVRG